MSALRGEADCAYDAVRSAYDPSGYFRRQPSRANLDSISITT